MAKKEQILELLNAYKSEVDNFNDAIFTDKFEVLAQDIVKLFAIPVIIDTLVCDCEIPKPKSPFIGDYEYDYCRDCDGHISQTNYL